MCFLFINGILDIQLLLTWGVVRRVFGTSPAPPAGPHQQFAHGPVPVDLSIFSSYAPVPIHADHRSNEKNNKHKKLVKTKLPVIFCVMLLFEQRPSEIALSFLHKRPSLVSYPVVPNPAPPPGWPLPLSIWPPLSPPPPPPLLRLVLITPLPSNKLDNFIIQYSINSVHVFISIQFHIETYFQIKWLNDIYDNDKVSCTSIKL